MTNLFPCVHGSVVFQYFGGTDPKTNFVLQESAFQTGFLQEAYLNAWAAVHAAPLTCKCMEVPFVACQLGDSDNHNEINNWILSMDVTNELACY